MESKRQVCLSSPHKGQMLRSKTTMILWRWLTVSPSLSQPQTIVKKGKSLGHLSSQWCRRATSMITSPKIRYSRCTWSLAINECLRRLRCQTLSKIRSSNTQNKSSHPQWQWQHQLKLKCLQCSNNSNKIQTKKGCHRQCQIIIDLSE